MAARSWEADFRYPAILASVEVVRDENLDEIFQVPRSYCLPVSERPAMRWSPGKLMLVFLVLGFAGIVGGGFFAMMAEKEKANGNFFSTGRNGVFAVGVRRFDPAREMRPTDPAFVSGTTRSRVLSTAGIVELPVLRAFEGGSKHHQDRDRRGRSCADRVR